jgi:ABC-2 type transport system ATP-binding protein
LHLVQPMSTLPSGLNAFPVKIKNGGSELEYNFDAQEERAGIPALLRRLEELGIAFTDLQTKQSSLEDIFVSLVHQK